MLLQRFYDTHLAQASYLVGCQATGEAIVIDPTRDVEPYLDAARAAGVAITHVTETHIHADFVSGARELAARTGAALLLSGEGGPDWQYAFAAADGARLLHGGDRVAVGNLAFDVRHTPGHTPEHLSFLVTDTGSTLAAHAGPVGVFTGDFVFVGDVGRPDLLEKAAGHAGTMEAAARTLFRSLQRFKTLPDRLQLWPGHGAGSACGKALGAVPGSTVGYEKRANWGLAVADEDEFVRMVLAGQPEPPAYFAVMKQVNKVGPVVLGGFRHPERLAPDRLPAVLAAGASVVDTRAADAFADGHVPGTINIPLGKSFTTWAGSLLPYDRPIYLLADDEASARIAVHELALIGLDHVVGYFGPDALDAAAARGPLQAVPQTDAGALARDVAAGAVHVLDVRGRAEWDAGHVPEASHIPLGDLATRLGEVPRDRPVVVHCQGGSRSAIAASLLQAHGIERVVNLPGGFAEWTRSGGAVGRPGM